MNRAELEARSDEDLIIIEDDLLFQNETGIRWNIRASGGRLVNFILSGVIWFLVFFIFLEPIKKASGEASPLVQFLWVIASGVFAVMISTFVWRILGLRGRYVVRSALHYWPVTISLIAVVWSYVRQS